MLTYKQFFELVEREREMRSKYARSKTTNNLISWEHYEGELANAIWEIQEARKAAKRALDSAPKPTLFTFNHKEDPNA